MDFLGERVPFFDDASAIMKKCFNHEIVAYIAEYTIPTVFYLLRKQFSANDRKALLLKLCDYIEITELTKLQIVKILKDERIDDVEDCMQVECALSITANYIITRNTGDFSDPRIQAITPSDFLIKHYERGSK
jgi:predicted nucleic acid-binding protein